MIAFAASSLYVVFFSLAASHLGTPASSSSTASSFAVQPRWSFRDIEEIEIVAIIYYYLHVAVHFSW